LRDFESRRAGSAGRGSNEKVKALTGGPRRLSGCRWARYCFVARRRLKVKWRLVETTFDLASGTKRAPTRGSKPPTGWNGVWGDGSLLWIPSYHLMVRLERNAATPLVRYDISPKGGLTVSLPTSGHGLGIGRKEAAPSSVYMSCRPPALIWEVLATKNRGGYCKRGERGAVS
jgi:hypothetical protein